MKIAGIIAEYNPFHNGHLYHLQKTREITNADYVVVVMSGNFTQRGTPALSDKYLRAEMALHAGADLILELPSYYATSSAEYFAAGAVGILHQLGCINTLSFGSESEDLEFLSKSAAFYAKESAAFREKMQEFLKQGLSYPLARAQAFACCVPDLPADANQILASSNSILAIEYLKVLQKLNSSIVPLPILRQGSSYLDETLSSEYSSAMAIRRALEHSLSMENISSQVPDFVFRLLSQNQGKVCPVFTDDFSSMLHYRLLCDYNTGYSQYLDVSEELSQKIRKSLNDFSTFEDFCLKLKSKDMTYTRISRCLTHILLSMEKADFSGMPSCLPPYTRILGFRENALPLLKQIKESASLCVISKPADASALLKQKSAPELSKTLWNLDMKSAHIYNAAVNEKFHQILPNEYSRQILKY